MARARTGGAGSGYAWALVIFGAGFVICLLLAIVFWAQLGGAREAAVTAQNELRAVASQNDLNRPEVAALRGQQGGIVGQLLAQNHELKTLVAGNADAQVEGVKSQLASMKVEGAMLRAISTLQATLADMETRVKNAEQARDAQQARAEAALQEQAKLADQYTKSVAGLQQQIAQLQGDLTAYKGKVGEMQQGVTAGFETDRRELAQRIAQLEGDLNKANTELKRAQDIIRDLSGGNEAASAKITQTDAVITGLIPDEGRVYLNRGKNDRITLGMTFEVFDESELVQLGELGAAADVRGKATVEVMDVRDTSSIARIVRTQRGQTVNEGDQLINVVYDPNATHKFYVYGDYDINNTGETKTGDKKRIENMVTTWGGRLVDQLSYDVDFLVLGERPPLPEPLPPGVIDPVRIAQNVEQQRNFETYEQLVGEARSLNIPILNQNRFLNLVGYYQR